MQRPTAGSARTTPTVPRGARTTPRPRATWSARRQAVWFSGQAAISTTCAPSLRRRPRRWAPSRCWRSSTCSSRCWPRTPRARCKGCATSKPPAATAPPLSRRSFSRLRGAPRRCYGRSRRRWCRRRRGRGGPTARSCNTRPSSPKCSLATPCTGFRPSTPRSSKPSSRSCAAWRTRTWRIRARPWAR
ncbi:hypothetical protein M885DRAFT_524255 [Pelagophyceae sp. CCMP2097]|nr:hypothetical protein M885DRAFT_524255 [Pelagophyceae sp. CCMP2097]